MAMLKWGCGILSQKNSPVCAIDNDDSPIADVARRSNHIVEEGE